METEHTRRRVLRTASVGGLGLVAGCTGGGGDASELFETQASDGPAWPTFFGGPGNRNVAADAEGPRSEPSVEIEASVDEDGGSSFMQALIADGTVWNRGLRRVDLSDGTVETDPMVEGASVLAATDEGVLANVVEDDRRGVSLYDHDLDRRWRSEGRTLSSVVVSDGAVFGIDRPEDDPVVVAIEVEDGTVRWESPLDRQSRGLAYWEGTVFVTAEADGEVVLDAIDASTGDRRRVWRRSLGDADEFVASIPVVADGTVYVARQIAMAGDPPPAALFAIDPASGTERWTVRRQTATMPVVTDEVVYSAGTAYDPADGSELWRPDREFRTSIEGTLVWSSPVATEGALFFADIDPAGLEGNALLAVSTADGSLLWRRDFDPGTHALRVVGDRLVVGTAHGEVYVLR